MSTTTPQGIGPYPQGIGPYSSDQHTAIHHYSSPKQNTSSSSWIWVIIIIIIIIVIVIFLFRRGDLGARPFTWNYITGAAGATDTFQAAAGNAYLVNPNVLAGFVLTLIPPSDPVGQMFLITNDSDKTITIKAANSGQLPGKKNSLIVWGNGNLFNTITPS